ncbi:MAG: hypothetical protein IKK92_12220 [Prevotella sp.]|nr:hypothetical protein [Prevotella sp.]MBQ2949955.1 hypothetical protein [Prevotella sp.]MBR2016214.1 hypothetical protein [Prevotella sp.]MBR2035676.1 hypothetical protein [Prevotella sp.]MBR2882560.1 hypothetical protein [Prevotella sp.]
MAKIKKNDAKREAYAKKQEQQGKNIVMWIIGILIAMAVCYVGWISFVMA